MCQWDDNHYLMCGGTHSGSDSETRDGIVDGHAYTILSCHAYKASNGDEVDLIKVRNPWGRGEFTAGDWIDAPMGRGWKKYPDIRAAIKPKSKDNGAFFVSRDEFFE